ncbi:MAG: AraC family transcriptional regulator [Acidobacteriota bacterium]
MAAVIKTKLPTPISEAQASINASEIMVSRSIQENHMRLRLLSDPPGLIEVPGLTNTIVSMHIGQPVQLACRRGGYNHRGLAVHGDIDIIPANTPSLWEIKEKDTAFIMSLSPELIQTVAEEFAIDPARLEIQNRFQLRDQQLENIGLVLKAEMESGYPCGQLYFDSLAVSVATRLLRYYSSMTLPQQKYNGRLPERKLRQVLAYIEDHLSADLSLRELAEIAGLSVSHFKNLFRESVGLTAHQYLIRRRVERAKTLLTDGKLSISQIAFETGFAHQSHLARHMRRLLGVSPKALRR